MNATKKRGKAKQRSSWPVSWTKNLLELQKLLINKSLCVNLTSAWVETMCQVYQSNCGHPIVRRLLPEHTLLQALSPFLNTKHNMSNITIDELGCQFEEITIIFTTSHYENKSNFLSLFFFKTLSSCTTLFYQSRAGNVDNLQKWHCKI